VGVGVGVTVAVAAGVDVAVGVGVNVAVAVGVGVNAVAVAVGVGLGGGVGISPPQIIISLPVHTAVCESRREGAFVTLVAVQLFALGSYLPPVSKSPWSKL
jgi:hypothetical protein